eukprot:GILJ01001050.1.p1 GENE.GILJ01001050.1~~GILJ01001050.1.p1  ORF type:complete len:296 (-),score=18.25 GILJ01001050.1:635-1522(-)
MSVLKLSDFRLGTSLGHGTYAEVRECRDVQTGEIFAIKIVDKGKLKELEKIHQWEEVHIQNSLSHPKIIKILHQFEDEDSFYLVMKFMRGGDLFDRIDKHRRFSENITAYYIGSIADALSYLHSRNILHRNLSPENVLFETEALDSPLALADFGFATTMNGRLTHHCGTRSYMAPEMEDDARRHRGYGKEIDMWALGVIMYILLTGLMPFVEERDKTLSQVIVEASPLYEEDDWKYISNEAKELVQKLLVKDPSHRLSADGVLTHPFIARYQPQFAQRRTKSSRICGGISDCRLL